MEIERKFLIDKNNLPVDLSQYPHSDLEQAYLITNPVLRIRKKNNCYILTYKGQGLMKREEVEFPLPQEAYDKLLSKTEGNVITKTRYKIPEKDNLTIELDLFHGLFEGLYLAEVEFPDEDTAQCYLPPSWFGREVTEELTFHNSTLSAMDKAAIESLISSLSA
ncbi:MAG: CYTH domain-containing protein [Lachnospiraceae bacterium]|nr:CYTH domain-containing protein [Lachnospiraceae bacterium]MDE6626184.1 CYTH domain-containing protein [Lachnospiraceae bacterium]